jgi:hypothetical protein
LEYFLLAIFCLAHTVARQRILLCNKWDGYSSFSPLLAQGIFVIFLIVQPGLKN